MYSLIGSVALGIAIGCLTLGNSETLKVIVKALTGS
jgi:hypothetical protein